MGLKTKLQLVLKRFSRLTFRDYVKYLWLPLVIMAVVLVLDLISKHLISSTMELYQTKVVIPNFLEFYFTLNDGAAFSILRGQMVFFIVMSIMALLLLGLFLAYGADRSRVIMKVAIAMLMGGAMGNFFDRLAFGHVRDFIHIIYFGWDLPLLGENFGGIFNVADIGVTVGAILFILAVIIGDKRVVTGEEMIEEISTEQEVADEKANSLNAHMAAREAAGSDNTAEDVPPQINN